MAAGTAACGRPRTGLGAIEARGVDAVEQRALVVRLEGVELDAHALALRACAALDGLERIAAVLLRLCAGVSARRAAAGGGCSGSAARTARAEQVEVGPVDEQDGARAGVLGGRHGDEWQRVWWWRSRRHVRWQTSGDLRAAQN
jgi:hypothetical protein